MDQHEKTSLVLCDSFQAGIMAVCARAMKMPSIPYIYILNIFLTLSHIIC